MSSQFYLGHWAGGGNNSPKNSASWRVFEWRARVAISSASPSPSVCEPPTEDTLILSPVLPISVDFVSDIYDQAVGPMLLEPEKNTESTQGR